MQLTNIYPTSISTDHRRYIIELLKSYRLAGRTVLYIPCVGNFTFVELGIKAGFEIHNIHTSDICLYSHIIGYLVTGQPLNNIDFDVVDMYDNELYHSYDNDIDKGTFILYLMKCAQLRADLYHESQILIDMVEDRSKYLDQIKQVVLSMIDKLQGINYTIEDVRSMDDFNNVNDVVLIDPPYTPQTFRRCFNFAAYIDFEYKHNEYNIEDFAQFHNKTLDSQTVFIWTIPKSSVIKHRDSIVYAKESKTGNFTYIITNDRTPPKVLNLAPAYIPTEYKLINKIITEIKNISFKILDTSTANYYNSILTNLGTFNKYAYNVGLFYGGCLFATVGIGAKDFNQYKTNYITIDYINVTQIDYIRLIYLLLTTYDFLKFATQKITVKNVIPPHLIILKTDPVGDITEVFPEDNKSIFYNRTSTDALNIFINE